MNKQDVYLYLPDLTEAQLKSIPNIIEKAGDELYFDTEQDFKIGVYGDYNTEVLIYDGDSWIRHNLRHVEKTSISYDEFCRIVTNDDSTQVLKKNRWYLNPSLGTYYKSTVDYPDTDGVYQGYHITFLDGNLIETTFKRLSNWVLVDFDPIIMAKTITENSNECCIFPKSKYGEFPDLTNFVGPLMTCEKPGKRTQERISFQYKDKVVVLSESKLEAAFYDTCTPLKKSITMEEVFEKAGLDITQYNITTHE